MELIELKPTKALNKAFLKVKPNRINIESFKTNLIQLIDCMNDAESEEFHKNLVIDFLKKTYYDPNHFINTKGRNDLVIHNGNTANSTVGVIIEAKKPTNKAEMITQKKVNTKAFQELVLYYLRERITHKNLEVKYLIATNINEWFIFDATLFDRLFAQNKNFVKQFNDFESGRLADNKTDFFYKQIAEPFIDGLQTSLEYTYFNIHEYQKALRNADKADDKSLIGLFKILSPEHLLKLPFANDSNSLDKRFYSELLHIIGLTETKEGGKKIIQRNKEEERNTGTMLEDAIIQLDSLDKLSRLEKPSQFGATTEERLFNVALELTITWVNRILFLKLLEAQLITYHKGDKSYAFLSLDKIKDYDDLNSLFFQVLARKHEQRNQDVKKAFEKVPYLNSSLFEPTELEHQTLFISNLRDDREIPILSNTVLKNEQGKKQTGKLSTLKYFFAFLDAYDFSSEGSEEIQEDNKTLINASVLGLIFEKINGYKDGSFFTPGFITMYMCRETIRKAVVQKFNEIKNWQCQSIEDLYDKIEDRKEANQIVNSIKICDPAVGSGHFLVSALNEMIAVKNDLKILQDRTGKRLKEYQVEVVNDELIVTEDGELFEYNPKNHESQRIQETLFHEKQTIIENCLFGVDINPNSVKICRLRLWIELLKNAYYKNATELETLPNIDINIKCGNSLISRFGIDEDLSQALKKSKWTIDSYKIAVDTYRNAKSKEEKREMERLISLIKSDFRSEIAKNDPKLKKLYTLNGELTKLTTQQSLFGMEKKEQAAWNKKVAQLSEESKKLEADIENIKANKIYENAFEWRFEFPEVLNDEGDFVGFDVIIGNPPYFSLSKIKEFEQIFKAYQTYSKSSDIYCLFYEKSLQLIRNQGFYTFITSNSWMKTQYGEPLRKFFVEKTNPLVLINIEDAQIFEEATVESNILLLQKSSWQQNLTTLTLDKSYRANITIEEYLKNNGLLMSELDINGWSIENQEGVSLKNKIEINSTLLKDWGVVINYGIKTGLNEAFTIDTETKNYLLSKDINCSEIIKPMLRGRDLTKYSYEYGELWIINTHNGESLTVNDIEKDIVVDDNDISVKINGDWISVKRVEYSRAKQIRINRVIAEIDFPAVFQHLSKYQPQLEKRLDKGEHWSNLRNCAYLEEFDKPKIIWGELSDKAKFTLDEDGYFLNNTVFFMTGKDLKYILAILNSKLAKWYFEKISTSSGMGTNRWLKYKVEQLPIKPLSETSQAPFIEKVNQILALKKQDSQADTSELEAQIDQLVYQLYELTEEEIQIIEGA